MLSTTELEAYIQRHDLSPEARQVIHTVRGSNPSRRVRSGTTNVACRYVSRKMDCVIQAESHRNELPAVVGWEFDPGTYEFYDQPPKIKLNYIGANGRRLGHMATVDFFLLQKDFVGWVECKTEEWLEARAHEKSALYVRNGKGHWRCPPGEAYAATLGLGFKVRSSAETNWVAIRNVEFLADYLDERAPQPEPDDVGRIVEIISTHAWTSLKNLLEFDHGVKADVIFKMIADGTLFVALDKDLLTEPERTMVFRDAASAEAYRIHLSASSKPTLPAIQVVHIVPGEPLLWDGKSWRIVNAGIEDVYLEDSDRVFMHIRRSVLEQLVKDGKITGLSQNGNLAVNHAEQALRSASPLDFAHALKRYRAIFPESLQVPESCASSRALRRWRALYRHAKQAYGNGFVGLLPKIHLRGNRNRKIDQAVVAIMDEVIDDLFAKPGQRKRVACWGDARLRAKEQGLPAPGEKTFRAQIRRRRSHDLKEAREGEKAAYDEEDFLWYLERTSPRHGERPYEIGHIDHTEMDLQFVGSRCGESLKKAWLTVLIDAYTRTVIAWSISFAEPSYRSCMMVIRDCIRRNGRIPKYIVVDKGPEFESIYFETLLAFLETHKKTRPGSKPRFGSVIERFFGMSNEEFIHNLVGNNQALQKPRRMSKSHDPRDLAVWTLPMFREAFEGFLDRVYHEAEHSALGLTPKQAMAVGLAQSGERNHTLIPYGRDFVVMCMPTTDKGTAKVEPGRGMKINYLRYWTPEFKNSLYERQNIHVRYDPDDASVAFAWLKDHWALCRSELAAVFQGRSTREISTATQELLARFKRTGERRAITAELIAHYLRETANTEQVLLRHKQHQEDIDVLDLTTRPALPAPTAFDAPVDAVWDCLSAKIFGEFE